MGRVWTQKRHLFCQAPSLQHDLPGKKKNQFSFLGRVEKVQEMGETVDYECKYELG
jgi:hypothetical protein